MGKKLKRKAEEKVVQTTDSPKKAKVENANVSEQKTPTKVKKQKGPKNNKTDANDVNSPNPNSNKENKKNTPQQNNEEANKTGKKAGNKKNKDSPKIENIIPEELAKNMNKRQKQFISKKVKHLIKIREKRGEEVNRDEINKLVKQVMEQKANPPKEETSVATNKTADKNEKSKPAKKQKKGGNKKPNM